MIEIKIRGDEGEIAGKFLRPYIVAGVRTLGLNPGERFSLVLKNRTDQVVEVRIFDGDSELKFSGRLFRNWEVGEGYNSQMDHWVIEPKQQITALSDWVARGALQKISVRTYTDGKFRTSHTAMIIVWRDLLWLLRDEWAQQHAAGKLRARWKSFSRFED